MSYHVFIERASNPSPGAIEQVASAISSRYGLPEAAIAKRMSQGRFRVKANVDLKTAAKFAADLETLGAVCTIVDSSADGVAPTAMNVPAAPGVAGATASRPPAIPSGPARVRAPAKAAKAQTIKAPTPVAPSGSALPPSAPGDAAPKVGEYQTGLAAAFGDGAEESSPDLSALDRMVGAASDTGDFQLSNLDGSDESGGAAADAEASGSYAPPDASAFAPPDAAEEEQALQLADVPHSQRMAAVAAPASAPAPSQVRTREDMFAPPGGDDELPLDTMELAPAKPRPAAMPAIMAPAPPPTPEATASGLNMVADAGDGCALHGAFDNKIFVRCPACAQADSAGNSPGNADGFAAGSGKKSLQVPDFKHLIRERFLNSERGRFAVGVFVIILLAWIPAKIFWGAQVDSAQAELNASMQEPRSLASEEPESWAEYGEVGKAQKAIRESSLFNTKITASLIWIIFGAGLGFVWFRKIPWDEL